MDSRTVGQSDSPREYSAIDLAKFICAILVVSGHVAPFGLTDNEMLQLLNYGIQQWLARIAVPFFFISSGFFAIS